jgi:tRNA/rRNA methyltransferase
MTFKVNLDHIAIVLVSPQIPENIGSAARAMSNMGLSRLILVNPKNNDLNKIRKTATGKSVDIIEQMLVFDDLPKALGPYEYVVGATARTGSMRPSMTNPERLAHDLISVSRHNRIAILFGPEDSGLSNEHLKFCQTIVTIPTGGFSSLNLAQAVMIICYELLKAQKDAPPESLPRLANRFELEGMYTHLQEILMKIGFINPQNPERWMLNLRRFLSRLPLRAREVKVVRGICRQVDWYASQRATAPEQDITIEQKGAS